MRIEALDGFRGLFLICMTITHTNMLFGVTLAKLNHHSFGWVEDAQGFVFISGLVVGLVYGRRLLRAGPQACRRAVWRRMRMIYTHQAVLILIFAVAAMLFAQAGFFPAVLQFYHEDIALRVLASLFLVSGSAHMGILPMYLWFLLAVPGVLWLFSRGLFAPVLLGSALLWSAAQTGLIEAFTAGFEARAAAWGFHLKLGIFFNILGWQVVFFSGLYIGYLLAADRFSLEFLRQRQWIWAFAIGLAGFLAFGIFDRLVFDYWLGRGFSDWVFTTADRGNFSQIYLLAFALDLFLVTWLLYAGPRSGVAVFAWAAAALEWLVTRRALVFLGRHSLHVFSAHLLVYYMIGVLLEFGRPDTVMATVIVMLSPLPLYGAAWWHAHQIARQYGLRKSLA